MAASVLEHRRALTNYISVAVMLLLGSACAPTTTVPASPASQDGYVLIVGSTALQPLSSFAASLFKKHYPDVRVEVRGGGSIVGLEAVSSDQADIGASDIYADANLYPDPNLTDHIICIVPFVLIVNPAISLTSLTQQQIVDIFVSGKLHNWRQLGGPALPIAPVARSDTSGTRASFLKYVLAGQKEMKHALHVDSSLTMLHMVAHIPGAIGYLALPALNTSVHSLAINGQTAQPAAIATGWYAFWGYEHMYTMSNRRNAMLANFLQFMLTAPIQDQAKRMGYIALDQIQLPTSNLVPPSSRVNQPI